MRTIAVLFLITLAGCGAKTVSHSESDSKDWIGSGTTHKESTVQISPNGEKTTVSKTVEKPAQP